jgi:hypothetical protein
MLTSPPRPDPALRLHPGVWRSMPRHVDTLLLAACSAAVVAIRLQLLQNTDFPLNDGALFLVFVEAVAATFPHLPATVDYNGAALPFAYPPLAFWLSAAGVRAGIPALAIVHVAPILMNVACVLLFAALLLRTGHSRLFTAVAVLVFGTTFRSWEWLVMGGGLSRGAGFVFLLLVLHALLPPGLWTQHGWHRRRLVLGGLAIGGCLLSHLEWGMLSVFCALVAVAVARPRLRDAFVGATVLGVVSAALVVPWFASVVQVHGIAPFQAASRTGAWRWSVVPEAARMVLRNSAQLLPLVAVGMLLAVRHRQWFWLLFAFACTLLVPRSGETPLVLGIGVLAAGGLFGAVQAAARWRRGGWVAAAAVVLAGAVLAAVRASAGLRGDEHFRPLPQPAHTAMAWVAEHHPGARFAILREAPWYYNATAEWFPVLARAVSVSAPPTRHWSSSARCATAPSCSTRCRPSRRRTSSGSKASTCAPADRSCRRTSGARRSVIAPPTCGGACRGSGRRMRAAAPRARCPARAPPPVAWTGPAGSRCMRTRWCGSSGCRAEVSRPPRIALAHFAGQRIDRRRRAHALEGFHDPANDLLLVLRPLPHAVGGQHAFERGDQVQVELLRVGMRGHQRGDGNVGRGVHRDQVAHLGAQGFDLLVHGAQPCLPGCQPPGPMVRCATSSACGSSVVAMVSFQRLR